MNAYAKLEMNIVSSGGGGGGGSQSGQWDFY